MQRKTIHNTVFSLTAFILLATTVGAATAMRVDDPPVVGPIEQTVVVEREDPCNDVAELNRDPAVQFAALDTDDFMEAASGPVNGTGIEDYLTLQSWTVLDVVPEEIRYTYRRCPNGQIKKTCWDVVRVRIDDGGASPILVTLTSTQEL